MHPAAPAANLTEAGILAALRDCYAPEVPCNIVDLGLVLNVRLAPDPDAPGAGIPGVPPRYRVHVALTPLLLASPAGADPEETPLIAQIKNRLAAFETISRTEVEVLRTPAWTPARISAEGRKRLAIPLTSSKPASSKPAHDLIQIQIGPGKT